MVSFMNERTFTASAGTWGSAFGLRIPREVRKLLFNRKWMSVTLYIEKKPVEINLTDSFWTTCNELRSKEIGRWLKRHGLDSWPSGNPPKIRVDHIADNKFKIVEVIRY